MPLENLWVVANLRPIVGKANLKNLKKVLLSEQTQLFHYELTKQKILLLQIVYLVIKLDPKRKFCSIFLAVFKQLNETIQR